MKCYYPIDSAGNRIGFKTPEACVYDASGTSLTTKLAQINSNVSNKVSVEINKYDRYDIDNASYSSKPCFLLEDENNKLCQFKINDLINLVYKNPLYPVDHIDSDDTGIFLMNQTFHTKSGSSIWIQWVMHQDNSVIKLILYYSMNNGAWNSYTIGQFNKPSNFDLS